MGEIIRDISERRANDRRLFDLAYLDGLTGLPNHAVVLNRVGERVANGRRMAILMLDLDGFKEVNDTIGYAAGDAILREVARRLTEEAHPLDTVARLGGDEFAILMPDYPYVAAVTGRADAIIAVIPPPIGIKGHAVHVGRASAWRSARKTGSTRKICCLPRISLRIRRRRRDAAADAVSPPLRDAVVRLHALEGKNTARH
ncbi:GGDEF domain-containing protein [Sphingomonas sp. 2SG]|uniref:GGDEF domain-containing protein n=1 Tax=Sphingomonas sp. 2SG TaxID=2502201 RepID=UPI0010F83E5A|nr:GGDEF domain-containing protein [Sphingomonas sp. 2SG]